jgi:hypothetical protein
MFDVEVVEDTQGPGELPGVLFEEEINYFRYWISRRANSI